MRLLAWWRARRARRAVLAGPHYVDQIQVLKAAQPLALPAIRPLRAVVAPTVKPTRTRKPKPAAVAEFRRTGTK